MRTYGPGSVGLAGAWMMTWGVRLADHVAGQWEVDSNTDDCFRLLIEPNTGADRIRIRFGKLIGQGASTTFQESVWQSESSPNSKQFDIDGLRFGDTLNEDPGSPTVNQIAHIEHVRKDAEARYTLIRDDRTTSVRFREYTTAALFNGPEIAYVRTRNALWDQATLTWIRDDNSQDAIMIADRFVGSWVLGHPASGSNTWADTQAVGTWDRISEIGVSGLSPRIISPTLTGNGFASGGGYGWSGGGNFCRKIISVVEGLPDNAAYVDGAGDLNEGRIETTRPESVSNTGHWPLGVPTFERYMMIPFHLPHESTITGARVNYSASGANRIEVGLWRDDMDAGTPTWERLQSAGNDTTFPISSPRAWEAIGLIDQFELIDNQRYRYAFALTCLANQNVQVFAVSLDYRVPYLSGA